MLSDIFLVPVMDKFLLHAPLHGVTALTNKAGATTIQTAIRNRKTKAPPDFQMILDRLNKETVPPTRRCGALIDPLFLGLIPTRGCNMLCSYCDFPVSAPDSRKVMSRELCRQAIDAYFALIVENKRQGAAIHFFGGEPFVAPELVFFAVEYARYRARQYKLELHIEATSNGLLDEPLLTWVAENFDSIVLSLDGKEAVQEHQRPAIEKKGGFTRVVHCATILAESQCNLVLRSCITQDSLPKMMDAMLWMSEQFHPSAVCMEPLTESERSRRSGLQPPDPWKFAHAFLTVEQALQAQEIECILSTADLSLCTVSSCPVGHDALIVSPDGEVDACYLIKDAWLRKGKDMHLGLVNNGNFEIESSALAQVRSYELGEKPLCGECFCRHHCAGGCHVNHDGGLAPGSFDDLCIRTRMVSIGKLLIKTGQAQLLHSWLQNEEACKISALWKNDRIEAWK